MNNADREAMEMNRIKTVVETRAAMESNMRANERQVGGNHYKTGGEEHWDRVARLQLDYFQAQIERYVERWKKKDGVRDLKKARHFLDKYIELAEGGKLHDWVLQEPLGYGAVMAKPRHPYDGRAEEGSSID